MSTSARTDAVDRFQGVGGAGPPVMLVSLKAGGVGLNLTAANHVVMYDLWWNPAVEQQVGVVVEPDQKSCKRMKLKQTIRCRTMLKYECSNGLGHAALESYMTQVPGISNPSPPFLLEF